MLTNTPSAKRIMAAALVFFSIFLSGCASTGSVEEQEGDSRDPLESFNRAMWTFNWEYADKYVLRPASLAYVEYTPKPIRSGLLNVAQNFSEPSTIVNNLLQAKFHNAAKTTSRFVLNTTLGLLGWFDPATSFGLERNKESFGEVLGVYGVGSGPFVMLPVLGPSDPRNEVGDFVDRYYWPMSMLDTWSNVIRIGIIALEKRAALVEQEPLINDSFDSYQFVKNAYFQNIEYRIHDGNIPTVIDEDEEAEIDAFLDEIDE